MILVGVRFVHYSPKDSESGIKEFIVADNLEQALAYIDREYMNDALSASESYSDCDECILLWSKWWEEHPNMMEQANSLGLIVSENSSVEGPRYLLSKWWKGTTWQEVNDPYYGVTHWDWSNYKDITKEDASVLVRLGVAKDIRSL